jgi:hypothetical protein
MAEKKIAVLVTDRESEALRMSLGLLLLGDTVEVYVLDRELGKTEENLKQLETMKEFEVKIYTNHRQDEGMEFCSTEEVALRLPQYDHVLPY